MADREPAQAAPPKDLVQVCRHGKRIGYDCGLCELQGPEAAPPRATPTLAEAIDRMEAAALNAVDHVGAANYAGREAEARRWVCEAAAALRAAAPKDIVSRAVYESVCEKLAEAQYDLDALRAAAPSSGEPLNEAWAAKVAGDAVQSLADSEPDGPCIEAQDLLQGTDAESYFVVSAETLESSIFAAISNALYDRERSAAPSSAAAEPVNEQRLREALTQAAHWFDEYVMAYGAKGDDHRKMLNLSRARACRAAIDAARGATGQEQAKP